MGSFQILWRAWRWPLAERVTQPTTSTPKSISLLLKILQGKPHAIQTHETVPPNEPLLRPLPCCFACRQHCIGPESTLLHLFRWRCLHHHQTRCVDPPSGSDRSSQCDLRDHPGIWRRLPDHTRICLWTIRPRRLPNCLWMRERVGAGVRSNRSANFQSKNESTKNQIANVHSNR